MGIRRAGLPLMMILMIGFTVWNSVEGQQSLPMIAIASLGTFALLMVLGQIAVLLPPTPLMDTIMSGLWVAIFMPIWDWLARVFTYPGSLVSSLLFAVVFALIRYLFIRRSARPPS